MLIQSCVKIFFEKDKEFFGVVGCPSCCCKGQLNSEGIYEVIISPKIHTKNYRDFFHTTVKDNPQLSDLKGPGTSKLDWRYSHHSIISTVQ